MFIIERCSDIKTKLQEDVVICGLHLAVDIVELKDFSARNTCVIFRYSIVVFQEAIFESLLKSSILVACVE